MERINILLAFLFMVYSGMGQDQQPENTSETIVTSSYTSFGEKFDAKDALGTQEISEQYLKMTVTDTTRSKFNAIVTDVCKSKGCWMKLQLENGQETMVRFKDYGFFVPKDITGKEVVVNGFAFVEEMSVEDQKHYAKDGDRSEAEIAKITAPKKTYSFEAVGVLLKE